MQEADFCHRPQRPVHQETDKIFAVINRIALGRAIRARAHEEFPVWLETDILNRVLVPFEVEEEHLRFII